MAVRVSTSVRVCAVWFVISIVELDRRPREVATDQRAGKEVVASQVLAQPIQVDMAVSVAGHRTVTELRLQRPKPEMKTVRCVVAGTSVHGWDSSGGCSVTNMPLV